MEWHRIDDPEHPAPKDGTVVDLWISGSEEMVMFYAPICDNSRGEWQGRVTSVVWHHKPPNRANWYPVDGLHGFPLSPEVTPTHWRNPPEPPRP